MNKSENKSWRILDIPADRHELWFWESNSSSIAIDEHTVHH